jgi:hypothetical protein
MSSPAGSRPSRWPPGSPRWPPRWRAGRGETALVADRGAQAAPCPARFSAHGRLRRRSAAPRRSCAPDRHDHELLDVDAVVGMGAAVEDVHHRHRQARQGPPPSARRGTAAFRPARPPSAWAHGQRHAQQGVGAQAALLGVPSSSIRRRSSACLIGGVRAEQRLAISPLTLATALLHALAEVAPRRRAVRSPRALPVEAPEGTAARPNGAGSSRTSASTVGLPRESRISRP